MRTPRLFAAALLTLGLGLACAGLGDLEFETRPPPSPNYVGAWAGVGLEMEIDPEGMVDVVHNDNGSHSEFSAPAMSWDAGELKIGIGPIVRTYTVNEPPHLVDGEWRMVVNGIVLVRTSGPALHNELTGKPIHPEPLAPAEPAEPTPTPE
jgi:hypothetical protein